MACLDNLIGVSRGCSTTTPSSGRYLNELPYISIEVAEATINSEQESGKQLLTDKITQAQNELLVEFRQHLMPRMRVNSVIQNDRVGYYPSSRSVVNRTADTYKGIRIDVNKSGYLKFYLNSFTLFLDATETVDVYLYDLLTGQELDTFSVNAVAGTPVVTQVDKGYSTNNQYSKYALVVSTTTANSYKTTIYRGYTGCVDCRSKPSKHPYATFYGTSIGAADTKIRENTVGTDNTFGLSIDYSLYCDVEPFICNMKDLLVQPLMYKAATLVLSEVKVSNRLNSIVLLHESEVSDLLDYYQNQYQMSLKVMLDTMRLPSDLCFYCNARTQYQTRVP